MSRCLTLAGGSSAMSTPSSWPRSAVWRRSLRSSGSSTRALATCWGSDDLVDERVDLSALDGAQRQLAPPCEMPLVDAHSVALLATTPTEPLIFGMGF